MREITVGEHWKHENQIYRLIHRAADEDGSERFVFENKDDATDIRSVERSNLDASWTYSDEDNAHVILKHLNATCLESDRLYYRPFNLSDANAIYENWMSDAEALKYLPVPPHESARETTLILQRYMDASVDCCMWAIVKKGGADVPIGAIYAQQVGDHVHSIRLYVCLGKQWWHQGYGSEAMEQAVRFFFSETNTQRIEAVYDTMNKYAGAVCRHCGFRNEGVGISAGRNAKKLCHIRTYALLKSEYLVREIPLEPVDSCPCLNTKCEYHGDCAKCRLFHIELSRIPQSYCIRFRKQKKNGLHMEAPL